MCESIIDTCEQNINKLLKHEPKSMESIIIHKSNKTITSNRLEYNPNLDNLSEENISSQLKDISDSFSLKCIAILTIGDEIKIIDHCNGKKFIDYRKKQLLLMHEFFYPGLDLDILFLPLDIDINLISNLINKNNFIKDPISINKDELITMLGQLEKVDKYFNISALNSQYLDLKPKQCDVLQTHFYSKKSSADTMQHEAMMYHCAKNLLPIFPEETMAPLITPITREINDDCILSQSDLNYAPEPVGKMNRQDADNFYNLNWSSIDSKKIIFLYNKQTYQGRVIDSDSFVISHTVTIPSILSELFPEFALVDTMDITDTIESNLSTIYLTFNVPFSNVIEFEKQIKLFFNPIPNALNYKQIAELITNSFEISDNIEDRIQFSDLLSQVCNFMELNHTDQKFVKAVLPQILKELNLQKKRYSSGIYWYGIKLKDIKQTHSTYNEKILTDLDLNDKFQEAKNLYNCAKSTDICIQAKDIHITNKLKLKLDDQKSTKLHKSKHLYIKKKS